MQTRASLVFVHHRTPEQRALLSVCQLSYAMLTFPECNIDVTVMFDGDRIGNSNAVDTICITVEDYCQDFIHLKDQFYDALIQRTQQRIACEYYKALFTAKYVTSTSSSSLYLVFTWLNVLPHEVSLVKKISAVIQLNQILWLELQWQLAIVASQWNKATEWRVISRDQGSALSLFL